MAGWIKKINLQIKYQMNENEHLPYKQERIDATEKTLKKMVAISAKLHHSSLKSLT